MENNKINLPKSHILNDCLIEQRNILIKSFKDELRLVREADFHTCDEVFNLVDILNFYSSNLRALNSLCSQIPCPIGENSSSSRFIDFDIDEKLTDDDMRIVNNCSMPTV